MCEAILYIAVAYILLFKLTVTITRHMHVFINIFQTKHFSAVKFTMGYKKNMSFLVVTKSSKIGKKVEKIGLGSFKRHATSQIVYVRAVKSTTIPSLFSMVWYEMLP